MQPGAAVGDAVALGRGMVDGVDDALAEGRGGIGSEAFGPGTQMSDVSKHACCGSGHSMVPMYPVGAFTVPACVQVTVGAASFEFPV